MLFEGITDEGKEWFDFSEVNWDKTEDEIATVCGLAKEKRRKNIQNIRDCQMKRKGNRQAARERHMKRGETRQDVRERRVKRQCLGLGILGMTLFVALTAQVVRKNQTSEVSYHTYIRQIQEESETAFGPDGHNFFSDPDAQAASEDILILVNKQNALPRDHVVELHWLENRSCAVAQLMYDALAQMLTDGSTEGRQFVVASGYRSRQMQQQLLEEDIANAMLKEGLSYQEAYEQETSETMPPGYSEHETGLAVDIVALDYQILDEQQEWTEENQWLQEHCSEYGFILRYPRGKEEITGVSYEAWHFRYVGIQAAREIMEQGITLEEYLENQ